LQSTPTTEVPLDERQADCVRALRRLNETLRVPLDWPLLFVNLSESLGLDDLYHIDGSWLFPRKK